MVQIPLMILALNSSNTIGKKLREMVDHMHEDKKFHTDAGKRKRFSFLNKHNF